MDWPNEALAGFAAAEDRELLRNLSKSDVNVLLEVRSHWEGSGDMKGTIVLTSRGPGNDITHATVDHGAAATLIIPLQPGEALLLRAEDKTDISDFHRSPSEHGYRFRML